MGSDPMGSDLMGSDPRGFRLFFQKALGVSGTRQVFSLSPLYAHIICVKSEIKNARNIYVFLYSGGWACGGVAKRIELVFRDLLDGLPTL